MKIGIGLPGNVPGAKGDFILKGATGRCWTLLHPWYHRPSGIPELRTLHYAVCRCGCDDPNPTDDWRDAGTSPK